MAMRSNSLETAFELDVAPAESLAKVTRIGLRAPAADWASLSMDCEARGEYEVRFCEGLLRPGSTALQDAIGDRKALLVTTPAVDRLYGTAMRAMLKDTNTVSTLVLGVREETKSMQFVETVCKEALARGLNRRGLLIGFGGGVCLDVVTLAASLIRRGVGHLRVPTTLIGQIDAGIGLKGAVNFCGKKSFVGCFHPPEQVLIDPAFLKSLPRRSLSSGIAEAVKMGIVRDPALFDLLESGARDLVTSGFEDASGAAVLWRSIWSMLEELRKNPYEDQTYERVVDFGHTFSPLLEGAMGFDIEHGEAVAIDIALSATIARTLGVLSAGACERILKVLTSVSLPAFATSLDVPLCHEALTEAARHRGGSMNLVVPTAIGRTMFLKRPAEVPEQVLAEAVASLSARSLELA
jgi:3-dehydroquinate synthetase